MRRKEEEEDEGKRPDLGGGRFERRSASNEKTERRPGLPSRPCAMYTNLAVTVGSDMAAAVAPPVRSPAASLASQGGRKAPTTGECLGGSLAESRVAIENNLDFQFCTVLCVSEQGPTNSEVVLFCLCAFPHTSVGWASQVRQHHQLSFPPIARAIHVQPITFEAMEISVARCLT